MRLTARKQREVYKIRPIYSCATDGDHLTSSLMVSGHQQNTYRFSVNLYPEETDIRVRQ